jgi:hypothetical protein
MKHYFSLSIALGLSAAPFAALGDCPVTLPSSSPVVVPDSGSNSSHAWYGSEVLAVLIPKDGRWKGMGPSHHFFDKLWVWRRGYSPRVELNPALTLAGIKLNDGNNPQRMHVDEATNAFGPGWASMLTGMEFPSAGCWEVTANYVFEGITHRLTFVVDVIGE